MLPTLLSLSLTLLPFVPPSAALTTIKRTLYCPYAISISPSSTLTSLDLTYTPTTTPSNPFYTPQACLIELFFTSDTPRAEAYFETVSYVSNTIANLTIETKGAWQSAFAPVSFRNLVL